jgi:pyrroline-5-carboxylate reductase
MTLIQHLKVGFIGAGNMTNIITKRLFETNTVKPENTWVSNRTPGKIAKLREQWPIQIANTNEDVVDRCQVVFLSMKPQDFVSAVEPLATIFYKDQIVISLLAGVPLENLEKTLPESRLVRVMANTPSSLGKGVIGFCMANSEDKGAISIVEELLAPLGYVVPLDEGDMFDALLVSCSSGPGFILELMSYWQDWIEERGFSTEVARRMTIETFLGSSLLASAETQVSFEELQQRVASKKGVTASGLDSMRELEIERALRLSFEKSWMRNQELSRATK